MIPSLEGRPTKAKEASSPNEVRMSPLDTNPVFQSLGGKKQPPRVFYKTAIPKNFVIFTGKNLYWGLFLIKAAGLQVSNCIREGL